MNGNTSSKNEYGNMFIVENPWDFGYDSLVDNIIGTIKLENEAEIRKILREIISSKVNNFKKTTGVVLNKSVINSKTYLELSGCIIIITKLREYFSADGMHSDKFWKVKDAIKDIGTETFWDSVTQRVAENYPDILQVQQYLIEHEQ